MYVFTFMHMTRNIIQYCHRALERLERGRHKFYDFAWENRCCLFSHKQNSSELRKLVSSEDLEGAYSLLLLANIQLSSYLYQHHGVCRTASCCHRAGSATTNICECVEKLWLKLVPSKLSHDDNSNYVKIFFRKRETAESCWAKLHAGCWGGRAGWSFDWQN